MPLLSFVHAGLYSFFYLSSKLRGLALEIAATSSPAVPALFYWLLVGNKGIQYDP